MAETAAPPHRAEQQGGNCERCGGIVRLNENVCLGCLLSEGLNVEAQSSEEEFAEILGEAPVPDPVRRIGNYEIVREIGRGGMGAVYLAERADAEYRKKVAIKLIKRGMDTDAVLERFRNERQILAGFDHPNIARLLDGGTTDDDRPYFVMEYVEGVPLDEFCGRQKLSVPERLRLFLEVCGAVAHAHRHLVIHRDLKRSNILVSNEGVPKLLDFGIAKILHQGEEGEMAATLAGARPLTPEYASPEQLRGESVTTASDVYSLGVVLYELLTGKSPHQLRSRTPSELARAVTETEARKPSTVVATGASSPSEKQTSKVLKGDLDNIVLKALRKEPERRYRTVDQFADDIRRHLESRPVLARKDTAVYRSSRFIRRNKAATAVAALLLLSLVAGIIATSIQANRAREAQQRAERRFQEVRKLANTILFDHYDAIRDLPGATRARERLVRDALDYLDRLAKEAGGDPTLQRELATAYHRVGTVRGDAFGASLGDRAGATESFMKALQIREALMSERPGDSQNRRDLAAIYRTVGEQFFSTANTAKGFGYLEKSLALYAELARENSGTTHQTEFAQSHLAMAAAMEDAGDMARALEHNRAALAIYERLLKANPSDRALRRGLSVSHEQIGRASFLNDDLAGAIESNQKALELREALLKEDPTSADLRRILAVSHQNAGDYLSWAKRSQEGLDHFRKKLVLDEQALAADPVNAQAEGDLAYSCDRIASLLADLGDLTAALPFHRRALTVYEKHSARSKEDVSTMLREFSVRSTLALALAKLGQVPAARVECEKAAAQLKNTPGDPRSAHQLRARVIAYGNVAEAHATLAALPGQIEASAKQDWQAARTMYDQTLQLMKQLREMGALDAEELPEIEIVTGKIAQCEAALTR